MSNKFANLIFSNNWQDNLLLNIVIPTYNRKLNLIHLIENLSRINNTNIGIIILDNNSNERIDINDIGSILLINTRIKIYYNDFHVCAEANHLRAMNLATSKWIYLLGDSKIPDNNTLNHFIIELESFKDYSAIIFSYDKKINSSFSINNLNDLFHKHAKFGDILLAGNVIISKKIYDKYINIASQFTITKGPLPIFILLLLNDNYKILLSKDIIIKNIVEKPLSYNPKLELLECWARFPILTLLPINFIYLKNLNRFIINNENFNSRLNFSKFILIKIFKEKKRISHKLILILKTRYIYSTNVSEYILIFILYFISINVEFYFKIFKVTKIEH